MVTAGADWYGYWNSGTPGTSNYNNNMDDYVHFPGWTTPQDNFLTPVTSLSSFIRQASGAGTDSYSCAQNQYTFGTIRVLTSQVDPNTAYFYSMWIPLAGVGGVMNNMTVDIGSGAACSNNILNDGIPDPVLSTVNVTVTSGAAIPAGVYRVLWLGTFAEQPPATPLTQPLFFKGDTKT